MMCLQPASLQGDNKNAQIATKEANLARIMPYCQSLFNYNLLTAFPLSDAQIQSYTETALRLKPEITPDVIRLIMDLFIAGRFDFEFDYKIGIRNIIKGYDALMSFKTTMCVKDESSWQGQDRNVLFAEILAKEPHRIESMTIKDVGSSDFFPKKFKGDDEVYNAESRRMAYRLEARSSSVMVL